MAENSKIEWTDHTFNPWVGCTKVSPGCAHCYAATLMDERYHKVKWGKGQPRQRTKTWNAPVKWNKMMGGLMCNRCEEEFEPMTWAGWRSRSDAQRGHLCGGEIIARRARVFCASLADWLDDEVPIEWLADLLKLIHDTPNLGWQLLTKRPQNWDARIHAALAKVEGIEGDWPSRDAETELGDWINEWTGGDAPANIWIGTTVEDQARADERIPLLLSIPARVRFLSCEPLLSAVDLGRFCLPDSEGIKAGDAGIHWIIAGGESGKDARPMDVQWACSLRDQCAAAGVPFFLKQMGGARDKRGAFDDLPSGLRIRQFPQHMEAVTHA